MWVVAKIKKNPFKIFRDNLEKKIDDKVEFYYPKISLKLKEKGKLVSKTKPLLSNYIFCKHEKFDNRNFLNNFAFLKGLNFFLNSSKFNQLEINNFISFCKAYEDDFGYLKNSFFKSFVKEKGKFLDGPFKNLVFEILQKGNNKIKILLGNYFVTIGEKSKTFYQPI